MVETCDVLDQACNKTTTEKPQLNVIETGIPMWNLFATGTRAFFGEFVRVTFDVRTANLVVSQVN